MRPRVSSFRTSAVIIVIVAALMTSVMICLRASAAAGDRPPDANAQLLVDGNDETYSIARIESVETGAMPPTTAPSVTGGGPVRAVIQTRAKFADKWKVVARLDSRPQAIAQHASELAVLLDDGSWMLLWPGGGSVGATTPPGTKIVTLGSDGEQLWALASGNLQDIPIEMRSAATTAPAATQPSAPATSASSSAAKRDDKANQKTSLGLFELEGGKWKFRARIPKDFVAETADDVSLSALNGHPALAIRDEREGHLHVLVFEPPTNASREPVARDLGSIGCEMSFKLLTSTSRPMLWIASGGAAGSILYLDELGKEPEIRELPEAEGLTNNTPRSIAAAAGSLRLVYRSGDNVLEQTYALDGKARGNPIPITLVEASSAKGMYEWFMVPVVLLLTLLLLGPARRRPGELITVGGASDRTNGTKSATGDRQRGGSASSALAPGAAAMLASPDQYVIAPMSSRILAVFVDALPLVIVLVWTAVQVQGVSADEKQQVFERWGKLIFASGVLYFVHTLLSEMIWSRTLGKWLFGIRVITTEGGRPSMLSIVVRNLVRVLEVVLVVPVLIVALTPLQQRAGDFAAGTVVVLDHRPDVDPSSHDRDEDADANDRD